ncbi:hypothetical protein ODW08_02450 [Candidatus Phytoplasma australasiaticum]|nr:hypothetical protein [Candidatus Phytoplasma australasiaticum]MDV3147200.1 hypothetical protein [Sweet potato little leaf phytoplasma]MDO8046814.1 hypothetical protein [Candidatus Phytoplasma australasiaticum]MDO8053378.1 hypothetical protein [Candidatus Phytoplasma australasiaticum]MDO8061254.1 hypothetical protein [Candidatus Phytoplasma australasiaticum]MDV3148130.1 hypothetical protein [Candidatus Phytoplasma australasiaticum]
MIISIIVYNSYNTIKPNNSNFKIINKSDNNYDDRISENSFDSTSTTQTWAPKRPKFRAIQPIARADKP